MHCPFSHKITNIYFLSLFIIFQVITSLGLVIYSALDFGLKENEERRLTPGLENILELMTSLGEGSILSVIWGFIYRDCTYAIACSMQKGGNSCDFKIFPPSFFPWMGLCFLLSRQFSPLPPPQLFFPRNLFPTPKISPYLPNSFPGISKKFLQIHAKEDAGEVGKTKVFFFIRFFVRALLLSSFISVSRKTK